MPNNDVLNGDTDAPTNPAQDNTFANGTDDALQHLEAMFSEDKNIVDVSTPDNPTPAEQSAEQDVAANDQTQDGQGDVTDNPDENNAGENDENTPPENNDENDDDDIEVPSEFNEAQQAIFNKVIGKIKSKLNSKLQVTQDALTAETTKVADLSSKVEQANAELVHIKANGVLPPPTSGNPLIGLIANPEQLQQYKSVQFGIREQIIANRDDEGGARIFVGDKEVELSPEQARDELLRIDRFINVGAPELERHLVSQSYHHKWLLENLPDVKNPQSKLSVTIDNVVAKAPVLKKIAGYKTAAFYFAIGQMLSQKLGGQKAWDYVNSGDGKVIPSAAKTVAPRKVAPPPVVKKDVPKQSGPIAPKRADGPLDRESAGDLLAERLKLN